MANVLTRVPAVVIPYGPSKSGKTTDCLYSVPRALFLANIGALKPCERVVGFIPPPDAVRDVRLISDATKLVQIAARQRDGRGQPRFDAVVVDDFSLMAESTASVLETKYSGFKFWGKLRDETLDFRNACRDAGLHVIINAHETGPRDFRGTFLRGGPKLPGRLPEDLPAACDLVLRATIDPGRTGWKGCYRCTVEDPNYISGDRHGVTPDMAPMNLREILRAAGYFPLRWFGLEWQDAVAERVAQLVIAGTPHADIVARAIEYCYANHVRRVSNPETSEATRQQNLQNERVIRWALRDGLDRATLRMAQSPLALFMNAAGTGWGSTVVTLPTGAPAAAPAGATLPQNVTSPVAANPNEWNGGGVAPVAQWGPPSTPSPVGATVPANTMQTPTQPLVEVFTF